MGNCASCLGFRHESNSDPDAQRLLGDPFPQHQYGSLNTDSRNQPPVDPEEIRRQRDALERLCAQTSDKLIDVTQAINSNESGSKMASDYSRLFHDRFCTERQDADAGSRPSSGSTATDEDETTWLRQIIEDGGGKDILEWKSVGELGSLSVHFDDVLIATDKGNGKSPRL